MTERIELAPGYSVSRVINGLWQLSLGHGSQPTDRRRTIRTLLRLVDAGFTTFDCADIYLGVEELLGGLLRELRASRKGPTSVQIHTKYVPDRSSLASLGRSEVSAAIERSLARLQVERLDLVQFHWWDYDQPGYVDVAGWLTDLCAEGKIRCLGTTNFDPAHLEELIAAGIPVATNQAQHSLLDRRVEGATDDLCAKTGIRLLCYGSLAGGFLSERFLGAAEPAAPFENRSLAKYKLIIEDFGGWDLHQDLLAALHEIARKHDTSIAAVAARWVLDRGPVGAVIIGARSAAHIEDNLSIIDVGLDREDRNRIGAVLARATGPVGEPFELEREPEGRHSAIMWTDLNSQRS